MIPYSSVIASFPLKFPIFHKFLGIRKRLTAFSKLIFDHLLTLDKDHTLNEDSLGKGILEFSRQKGITEENVLAEIEVMFVAGTSGQNYIYAGSFVDII